MLDCNTRTLDVRPPFTMTPSCGQVWFFETACAPVNTIVLLSLANTYYIGSPISSGARRQPSSTGRRRSTVLHNLHLNDPSLPAPGEMIGDTHPAVLSASPHSVSPIIRPREPQHSRNPSLGELHQELEQEQEAQVVSSTLNESRRGDCLEFT